MKSNLVLFSICLFVINCAEEDESSSDNIASDSCNPLIAVDSSRGECTEMLSYSNEFSMTTSGDLRKITANNIPAHSVGLFGNAVGALNPNAITPQNSSYDIDLTPEMANSKTQLFDNGPAYSKI